MSHSASVDTIAVRPSRPSVLQVALINNMPDAALEATETQFTALLRAAAGHTPIQIRFSHLPEIARSPAALERLRRDYCPIKELFDQPPDALIVTGAEPQASTLRDEPYWHRFTEIVDWAQHNVQSSIWSCLAAHAAVEHLNGISRRPLARKCCGVFEHGASARHALMNGVQEPLRTPHSRWNELAPAELVNAGYGILSSSSQTGADIFIRERESLMVFFQGHPEYETLTLMKEYRRDVERYFRGEYSHFPDMPHDYFSTEASATLDAYRDRSLRAPLRERENFPYAAVAPTVQNPWREGAIRVYGNWLASIAAAKNASVTRRVAS